MTAVAAFYRFTALPDGESLRPALASSAEHHGLKGTIILAPEGINATIAGPEASLRAFFSALASDPRFEDLPVRWSRCTDPPFRRMKVKWKREIITYREPAADPLARAGTYVPPAEWNALIANPETLVLDTRNTYEVAFGTFTNAVDPKLASFEEFRAFAEQLDVPRSTPIAMFCTGGIRCEKASAHLRALGFENVNHLRGGILAYLEQVDPAQSLWNGECFVFDERVALAGGLHVGHLKACPECGLPMTEAHPCSHAPVQR